MSTVAANKLSNVSKTKQIDVDALIDKTNASANAADIANSTNPLKGAGLVGWQDTNISQYLSSFGVDVSVTDTRFNGGAKGDGGTSDAKAFQMALNYVNSKGGGRVFVPVPSVEYVIDYPVYVWDDTELYGVGQASKVRFHNPTFAHGRGGFVMGSSVEANRAKAIIAYENNTFPAASTIDNTYVNLALGVYLRDNPSKVETKNSAIHDLYITASWDSPTGWGGYAINFVNAWNCHAWNIWGEGWTQIIGMGSDVTPETPSNHACTAHHIYCMKPDPLRTYYSVGFMANSSSCHIYYGRQYTPCTGTLEGNMAAANSCEDSSITDMRVHNLGKIGSSAVVYVADCRNFFVDNIYGGNCKRVVQTFFFRSEAIIQAKPIIIGRNIVGVDSDVVVSIGTKYTKVLGFTNINCTYDIEFYNTNVTGCEVLQKPEKVNYGVGWTDYQYLDNNTVIGWKPTDIYLRPADMLVNDKIDTTSWTINKNVTTKAGVALSFMWKIPAYITAIRGFTLYTTYANDSATAGMNVTASIRRMAAFNGNSGEAAVVHQTISTAGAHAVTTDRLLTSSTSLVINADATAGLPYSLDYVIQVTAPTLNSAIKETRLRCYM